MKNKLFISLWLIGVGVILGCQDEKPKRPQIFTNDFESYFGYDNNVYLGKGYSGKAYYRMNPDLEFSPTFIQQFRAIDRQRFSKVIFSGYVYMPYFTNSAVMTIQIWAPNGQPIKVAKKNLYAQNMGINRWSKVSFELPLEKLFAPDNQLRCFIHNPSRQIFYLDDLSVEFLI